MHRSQSYFERAIVAGLKEIKGDQIEPFSHPITAYNSRRRRGEDSLRIATRFIQRSWHVRCGPSRVLRALSAIAYCSDRRGPGMLAE